ncbi:MAG: hypothetical protein ISS49_10655 [Anaerolineae bacterium]|nr:hypothetical protein [Anaerolineae bacterium]
MPRRLLRSPALWLFVACLTIYGLTAGVSLARHSLAPHFVYLAESFLHGRLDLIHVPTPQYDLTLFEGRWYVSFPPLPALLLLPLVALRGLAVPDIAFSVVMGALNVALFYAVLARLGLRARASRAPTWDLGFRIWLCLLLGLGTPLWYCAALGSVWYTAHVVAVTCLCLYALEVLGQNRPVLAGLWLGLGFLARAPVLLAFPLTLALGFQKARNHREGTRFLLLLALGMAPALLGQAAYNWARFGSPLEFGYHWMNSPGPLLERQATWGQFSLHFLPENLYTLLIRPPLVSRAPLRVEPDPWGMGLLLTCPALLLVLSSVEGLVLSSVEGLVLSPVEGLVLSPVEGLVLSPVEGLALPALSLSCAPSPKVGGGPGWGLVRALRLGLWLSIALVLLPSLLYFNTGSYQFGYRFALDWLPLGLLLVTLGTGGRLRWWGKALIVVSVLMHLWGVSWMYPNFNAQPWYLQYVELLH